jgi:protein ImuB
MSAFSPLPSSFSLYACLRCAHSPDLVLAVAKDFSPRVHRQASGVVVLDVSGLERLLGSPETIGAELLRACGGAPRSRSESAPSVAVAPSQVGALLLASAAPGLTVAIDDLPSALAPIPLRVLHHLLAEIHGITVLRPKGAAGQARQVALWKPYESAFSVLEGWGLTTLGELVALPADALSARLGQLGIGLREQARGHDLLPLVPDPEVGRFIERVELEWPIDALEPLSFVFARMLDPLATALERADRAAAALRLDLRLVDRSIYPRVLQLPAAIRDPRVLRTLLLLDLESHPPSAAVDIVTLEIDPAPSRIVQFSLLTRARPSAETVATLTSRLSALVGESRSGTPVLLDSWQPDAFEIHRFNPEGSTRQVLHGGFYTAGSTRQVLHGGFYTAGSTRQVLTPQSPIGPGQAAIANRQSPIANVFIRRFRPPVAVRVRVEGGRPVRVAVDRRGIPGGHVEQAAGPWRSSGAWWDRVARAWNRDEWDVALSDGSVCRLFRDRESGTWFVDGVID